MKVVNATNVNEAYHIMIRDALARNTNKNWRIIAPRQGKTTFEYRSPVTTVYTRPRERAMFNFVRDANPFFHVMEALWMLAGRADVEFLSQFNSNIHKFSDDGKYFHGAYGERLRRPVDQLDAIIKHLSHHPDSRRAVAAMWDPVKDLNADRLDIPCNTHIYFKIRDAHLDMTVCCRSNDMIWGCYGANYVHFSFFQEYVARGIGIGMGEYRHVSDSFHIYEDNPSWQKHVELKTIANSDEYMKGQPMYITPLIDGTDRATFDFELREIFFSDSWHFHEYRNIFLGAVAVPMRKAWFCYKANLHADAVRKVDQIDSTDWRLACQQWINRRRKDNV